MNLSSIILLLCAVAVSPAFAHGHHPEIEACMAKLEITHEDMKSQMESWRKGEATEDGNPKMKCFHKCMFEESGAITPEGKFDMEAAIAKIDPNMPDHDKFAESMKTCGEQINKDDTISCETSDNMMKCMMQALGPPPPHHHHD